jgi:cytochrome c oxidase subunit 2
MPYQKPRRCQARPSRAAARRRSRLESIATRRRLWFAVRENARCRGARERPLRRAVFISGTIAGARGESRPEAAGRVMKFDRIKAVDIAIVAFGILVVISLSFAGAPTYGRPEPGQIGFQLPASELASYLQWFHNGILMPIIVAISLFVLALLGYVVWKFNENANPTPSKTTHNATLEVIWTLVPVLILVVIAIPSFRLLTMQLTIPPADVTVKVTGSQWHWSYAYPKDKDKGGFAFDSYMKDEKDLKPENGDIRLLSVDNEAVVPINKVVLLQVTAADVIHSFIIQSFGVRMDAVPGRLNEIWFKANREGIYYGQCSKICGKDHAFMPIAFRVVSEEKYQAWLADAAKKFASVEPPSRLAAAEDATRRQ